MHYLVISTPKAEQPSSMRKVQVAWWDWINALKARGVADPIVEAVSAR